MTVVTPKLLDAVSASSLQWGLVRRHLLSAMSGSEEALSRWPESSAPPGSGTLEASRNQANLPAFGQAAPSDNTSEESPERRKLRNEDSSYDSDFDPCEPSSPRQGDTHEDVSRTASETLAAEFEEYVTLQPNPSHIGTFSTSVVSSIHVITLTEAIPQPQYLPPCLPEANVKSSKVPLSNSTTNSASTSVATSSTVNTSRSATTPDSERKNACSIATIVACPEYPQQVEFGVKLGYSENLVQIALAKLGLNPDKNKLLDELIRLGAGAPRPEDTEEIETEEPREENETPQLRQIIIDGSNVAMSHGNKTTFSCKGIRLCVDWFRSRGHKELVVFVPLFRKETSKVDSTISEQEILFDLERDGILSFTPSRIVGGKRIVAYDDRYILKEAIATGGVVVSNDNYRDLATESSGYRKVVEESLLMYSWVNGRFEPPDDPLGRNGPSLDIFLKKSSPRFAGKDTKTCPYLRKCTYGNKCKYTHPERGTAPIKSVTERLQEQAQKHYQEKEKAKSRDSSPGDGLRAKSLSLPVSSEASVKRPLTRTQSNTPVMKTLLSSTREESIPGNSITVSSKMQSHPLLTSTVSSQNHRSFDPMLGSVIRGDSSLFSVCPPHRTPSVGFGNLWSWGAQNQEPPIGSQSSARFPALPLGKQLPDHDGLGAENPHTKLQRQLSINPVHDSRLSKKYLIEGSDYSNLIQQHQPGQPHQPLHQKLLQQQQHCLGDTDHLTNRSSIGTRCISPSPAFTHSFANRDLLQASYHPPLTRHSSSQETKPISSYTQHMYPPYIHSHVTRNLSAPDAVWGGGHHQPGTHAHSRLSSTSDSRLNIHGCDPQLYSDPFDDPMQRLTSYPHLQAAGAPGPVGSRPLSPQQSMSVLQPSPLQSPRSPQHLGPTNSLNLPPSLPSKPYEDERFKIFYHLSQLFPEAQVRAALVGNPQETDPTKICASILNVSPSQVSSRPLSPQQLASGGVPFGGIGGHVSLRGSSSLGTTFSLSNNVDMARETARMEAYSYLSKLFIEEQVRKVLAAYPEETDSAKLCMLLVALNSSQS